MNDLAEPPSETDIDAPVDTGHDPVANFEANLARVNARESGKPAETPAPEAPKVEPATKKDGAPDVFMREEAPKADDDARLLDESPKGPVKHEHFSRVQTLAKERIAAAQAEAADLRAKLAEFEARGADPKTKAELDQIRKERDDYEARLEREAFERSPKFQREFVAKESAIIKRAERYLADAEADPGVLRDIASLSGKRRIEAIENLDIPATSKGLLTAAVAELDALKDARDEALNSSKELRTQWESEAQAKAQADQERVKAEESRVFEAVSKKVAAVFEPFKEVEGHPEWNAEVKANREKAQQFFSGDVSLDEMAEIVHYGVGGKRMHEMFHMARKENSELRAQVAALQAAQPGAGDSRQTQNKPLEEMTPEQRWEYNRNAQGGR